MATYEDSVNDTFEKFKTPWRIKRYMEENFSLVMPKKLPLGKGSFQYVPVVSLLQKITADKNFKKLREDTKKKREDLLEDVEDGHLFQSSYFFKANPEALR
jgi:hypothetical protein